MALLRPDRQLLLDCVLQRAEVQRVSFLAVVLSDMEIFVFVSIII